MYESAETITNDRADSKSGVGYTRSPANVGTTPVLYDIPQNPYVAEP
jgi:hypothetical protein